MSSEWGQLRMFSADGRSYRTDALNAEGAIGSAGHIRSPHIEAFTERIERSDGGEKEFHIGT
ncbi:MAG: hypothetical protein FWG58_03235 [Methanomassiliicoccaceae archaeon]|nr:hypothetical protein [Methanomassiliicoccaceae archaeon]